MLVWTNSTVWNQTGWKGAQADAIFICWEIWEPYHSFWQSSTQHIHMRMVSCLAFTAQIHCSVFLSACAFCWIFLRATVMVCLGIYRTFEVGSDAGIISWCFPHELVQEVRRRQLWSCPAGGLYLLLTGAQSDITQGGREGGKEREGNKYKEREDLRNSREECVYVREVAVGVVKKKKRESNRTRSQQLSPSQSSAKNTQRWMGKWVWKMAMDGLPQLATKSLSISHHVWDLLSLLGPNYSEAKQKQR